MYAVYNPAMRFDGKKMARLRKAAGMIQADLAIAVQRSRVTISDIERGHLRPGPELAERIANVLAVSLDDLCPAGPETVTLVTAPEDQDPNELQLVTILRSLAPVQRAKLTGFALGLASLTDRDTTDDAP